ncbi:hypothetical protein Tco_0308163 [Tanacetum coccineum]
MTLTLSVVVPPGSVVVTTGSVVVPPGSVVTTGSVVVPPGSVVTTGRSKLIVMSKAQTLNGGSRSFLLRASATTFAFPRMCWPIDKVPLLTGAAPGPQDFPDVYSTSTSSSLYLNVFISNHYIEPTELKILEMVNIWVPREAYCQKYLTIRICSYYASWRVFLIKGDRFKQDITKPLMYAMSVKRFVMVEFKRNMPVLGNKTLLNFLKSSEICSSKKCWQAIMIGETLHLSYSSEILHQSQKDFIFYGLSYFVNPVKYLDFSVICKIPWNINDMHTIGMTMQQVQVNTKFLNAISSEWSKFVTDVKLAKSMYTTNYDQLYAYLSQHERHANDVRITRERYPDPLAFVANSPTLYNPSQSPQHLVTQQSQDEFPQLDPGLAILMFQQGEYPIECINKAMAFLSAVASRFPPSNNQLRTSSNPRNQATIQDGRVTVQQVQGRQNQSYNGTGNKGIATTSKGNVGAGKPKL